MPGEKRSRDVNKVGYSHSRGDWFALAMGIMMLLGAVITAFSLGILLLWRFFIWQLMIGPLFLLSVFVLLTAYFFRLSRGWMLDINEERLVVQEGSFKKKLEIQMQKVLHFQIIEGVLYICTVNEPRPVEINLQPLSPGDAERVKEALSRAAGKNTASNEAGTPSPLAGLH